MKIALTKPVSWMLLGAALAAGNVARAVSFNYASEPGAFIVFNGASQFGFTPAVNNFQVTSGTAATLLGQITGTYTIGAVTTVGPTSSAPVTGSGSFIIHDGGTDLTGTLSWVNISQTGTGGTLNTLGSVNLTGVTYTGANPDLVALKNASVAMNVLTFQFIPAMSLDQLKTTQASTSFSGSVTTPVTNVPDGGVTVAMLGLALTGLAAFARRFFV